MRHFYIYSRRANGTPKMELHPVAAVAIEKTTLDSPPAAWFAVCSLKDNFSKKVARQILSGRIEKTGGSTILKGDTLLNLLAVNDKIKIKHTRIDWVLAEKHFRDTIADIEKELNEKSEKAFKA
jgi:hypothetical protein